MPPPDAPSYFPVPPVILYGYSLSCEPSSQVSCILSPPLRLWVQVPLAFSFHLGMYWIFCTMLKGLWCGGSSDGHVALCSPPARLRLLVRLVVDEAMGPTSLIVVASPAEW